VNSLLLKLLNVLLPKLPPKPVEFEERRRPGRPVLLPEPSPERRRNPKPRQRQR
jgi:hypothetical protein